MLKFLNIPDWLHKLFDRKFSSEEINKIKSLGDFDKLIEILKDLRNKKRHQGGNKWIGTSEPLLLVHMAIIQRNKNRTT